MCKAGGSRGSQQHRKGAPVGTQTSQREDDMALATRDELEVTALAPAEAAMPCLLLLWVWGAPSRVSAMVTARGTSRSWC